MIRDLLNLGPVCMDKKFYALLRVEVRGSAIGW